MLIRILALLLIPSLAFAQATGPTFDACQPPGQWPLADYSWDTVNFVYDTNDSVPQSSGWDPAYFGLTTNAPAGDKTWHQTDKTYLTNGIQTYSVGRLDADQEAWAYSCDISNAVLSAADAGDDNITQINLTDHTGVWLVQNKDFTSCVVRLQADALIAFHNSYFDNIEISGDLDKVWIVDSTADRTGDGRGMLVGGQSNDGCDLIFTYSQGAGGRDAGKSHGVTYYRNHLHASEKVGEPHSDGIQINSSSSCSRAIENNLEMLYRMTNYTVFWQNSNPGGPDDMWIVNNLLSGGQGSVDLCGKETSNAPRFGPCGDTAICGNTTLGDNGRSSWANPTPDKSNAVVSLFGGDIQDIPGETNVRYVGPNNGFWSGPSGFRSSITDTEGDTASWPTSGGVIDGPVPATGPHSQAAIESYVAELETWVAEIRAAAGASTTPPGLSMTMNCVEGAVGSGEATCSMTVSGGTPPYTYYKDCVDDGVTTWISSSSGFTCSGLTLDTISEIQGRVNDSAGGQVQTSTNVNPLGYLVTVTLSNYIAEETADSVTLSYETNWTPTNCSFDLDGDGSYTDTCSPDGGTCNLPDSTFTEGQYTLGVSCDGTTGTATLTATATSVGPSVERVVLYGSTDIDELGDPIPTVLVDPFEDGAESFALTYRELLDYFGADVYLTGGVQPTASECVEWELTTQDGTVGNIQGSVPHCFFLCEGQSGLIPAGYFDTAGAASLAVTVYDGPKVAGACTGNAGPTTTINFTVTAEDPSPSTTTILRGVTLTGAAVQ